MEIEVRLFATLQEYLPKGKGKPSFKLEIRKGDTAGDVLRELKIPEKIPKILLINGDIAGVDSVLQPGVVLSIFPALGGG